MAERPACHILSSIKAGRDRKNMKEVWKEIPAYNGDYFVSNYGRIKSCKRAPIIMKPSHSSKYPYHKVQLFKKGKYKIFPIHRLVAENFIPKVEGKDYINHIDGNPSNNRADNLEWCTLSENSWHSWNIIGRKYGGFKRKIICEETGIIYQSIHECARQFSVSPSTVYKSLNLLTKDGKKYRCRGLHFKYID